jgi:hypothetical protein
MPAHLQMLGRTLSVHPLVRPLGAQKLPDDAQNALIQIDFLGCNSLTKRPRCLRGAAPRCR